MTFQTAGKFLIVFVRLILGLDLFTGPRWESDSDKKVICLIKFIRVEIEIIAAIFP